MKKGMRIETRLFLSKAFPAGSTEIKCGRYSITAIPSTRAAEGEAVLEFVNTFEAPEGGGSNPEEEANIVCNLLSLVLEARIRRSGLRVNAIDIPANQADPLYQLYRGRLDAKEVDEHLRRALSLPIELARQLSRACRAFGSALEFIPSDPTFAFFLLVVAVECLSSQAAIILPSELDLDSKKCERFCTFIDRFMPDGLRGEDEKDPALFRELLKTIFFSHRSAFVHGGKEVSSAALMADMAGSSYFKHAAEGREVKTPGLAWFARIVRGAILGYLQSLPIEGSQPDEELLARLAYEKAVLKIKARGDLEAGRFVTLKDVEYR